MSEKTITTILDHVDNIRVQGRVFHPPANEYWQVVRLWQGMELLYRQAATADRAANEYWNTKALKVEVFGQFPPGISPGLLECTFDWYAVTACKFVWLMGEIGHRADSAQCCRGSDYVSKVIPDVRSYRDKIGAHFAWATENKRDNSAERIISVFPQVLFSDDTFVVQGHVLTQKSGDKVSTSDSMRPWSVRKTHEMLRCRYQPALGEVDSGLPANPVQARI